jgi:hypothetical protein
MATGTESTGTMARIIHAAAAASADLLRLRVKRRSSLVRRKEHMAYSQ